ncbi:hypothetical protein FGIG_01381 [Fasciola gigantica]|uniref:Uncharacterized protein n=1 Tax=Fasciola gigantica TaxID=46835 RepID=A0A504YZQ4_FASGI|nr:hypothetical protein FGIG_01381 [Fasciola gigantica]
MLRTARKFGPSASRNSMNISTRSLRAKSPRSSLSRTQSSKPRSKSFKYQKASKEKSAQESVPTKEIRNDSLTVLSTDSKRRRTDAAEYIKKRFLYDVDDKPKRFKSRKSRSIRLPTTIVAASRKPRLPGKHDWRTGSPSEDGMLPLRSRRGRRVKPKQDYSPLSYENKKSPPYVPEDNVPLRRTAGRKGRRSRRPEIPPEPEVHQRRSTWELPDLFNADDNDQMDDLSQTESYSNDAHKQRVSPSHF